MKYQFRWWATKKDVSKTADGGYNQEKIDVAGEMECSGDGQRAIQYNLCRKLNELEDYDYIEFKILRLKESE